MNLLLFATHERIDSEHIEISGRRVQHLQEVHGAEVGRELRVGELGGDMGMGTVVSISTEAAQLKVSLTQPPPIKIPLTLVLALPRPKMLRRILRSVAEFGVRELHLINSYRVEKSYWQTPVLQDDSIREYLCLGLEQAGDTVLPAVHLHQRFKPWVEDVLPHLKKHNEILLCHPGEYPPCPRELKQDTVAIIGPEGGFIPYEVDKIQDAGCNTVTLGERILRVENAVSLLLGRLV